MNHLTETAFHEAGHAVIAWHVGAVLGPATIVPDYDDGTAGHVLHGDSDAEAGDLGISFAMHPDHGLVAFLNETDDTCRLVTPDEREHVALVDEIGETYSDWWQGHALICAAGEASGSHAAGLGLCSPACGSDDDRRRFEAEAPPGEAWKQWVERAREILARPPVWARVERLAKALLTANVLEPEQVLAAVRGEPSSSE